VTDKIFGELCSRKPHAREYCGMMYYILYRSQANNITEEHGVVVTRVQDNIWSGKMSQNLKYFSLTSSLVLRMLTDSKQAKYRFETGKDKQYAANRAIVNL